MRLHTVKCLLHRSSVHCCHLGVGLCESPMSAVQGQFLECSSVCGPRASVPEPGDMSHHLISSTNQRCHMRECHIRAYVNYLISLVNVIVQQNVLLLFHIPFLIDIQDMKKIELVQSIDPE